MKKVKILNIIISMGVLLVAVIFSAIGLFKGKASINKTTTNNENENNSVVEEDTAITMNLYFHKWDYTYTSANPTYGGYTDNVLIFYGSNTKPYQFYNESDYSWSSESAVSEEVSLSTSVRTSETCDDSDCCSYGSDARNMTIIFCSSYTINSYIYGVYYDSEDDDAFYVSGINVTFSGTYQGNGSYTGSIGNNGKCTEINLDSWFGTCDNNGWNGCSLTIMGEAQNIAIDFGDDSTNDISSFDSILFASVSFYNCVLWDVSHSHVVFESGSLITNESWDSSVVDVDIKSGGYYYYWNGYNKKQIIIAIEGSIYQNNSNTFEPAIYVNNSYDYLSTSSLELNEAYIETSAGQDHIQESSGDNQLTIWPFLTEFYDADADAYEARFTIKSNLYLQNYGCCTESYYIALADDSSKKITLEGFDDQENIYLYGYAGQSFDFIECFDAYLHISSLSSTYSSSLTSSGKLTLFTQSTSGYFVSNSNSTDTPSWLVLPTGLGATYTSGVCYLWDLYITNLTTTFTQNTTYYFDSTVNKSVLLSGNSLVNKATFSSGAVRDVTSVTSYSISHSTTSVGSVNSFTCSYTYDGVTKTTTTKYTTTARNISVTSVTAPSAQTYTGSALTPVPTITYNGSTLSTSYRTLTYTNNTNAGTATITITGKGVFTGSRTTTFKINAKSLSGATVTLTGTSYTYTSAAISPSVSSVVLSSKTLTSGTDYTVAYTNNTNVGTATVTITGKGNYTGTVTKTFTITALSISGGTITLGTTSYTYNGSAKTPTVTFKLTVNGTSKTLTSGTDYTVTYTNNTNAGTATVTVTAKGNFTGTKTATFTINKATPTSTMMGTIFKTSDKMNAYVGQALSAFTSSLNSTTYGSWSFTPATSTLVGACTVGTANASTGNAIAVVWTPNSTYSGNYTTKSSTCYFLVDKSTINISKINTTSGTYTGSAMAAPEYTQASNTVISSSTLASSLFTYSYKNSAGTAVTSMINAGTYTVTVTFAGNATFYSTSKSFTYTVNTRAISAATIADIAAQIYTRSEIVMTPSLTYNSKTLVNGTDFTFTTANNTNPGTATITITGIGNYSGTTTKTFTINKRALSNEMVTSVATAYYTGEVLKPEITIVYNGVTLRVGDEYTIAYTAKDVTTSAKATVTATSSSYFTGSITVTYEIKKSSIPTDLIVQLSSAYSVKVYDSTSNITLPSDSKKGTWKFNTTTTFTKPGGYDVAVTYYPVDTNYDAISDICHVTVNRYTLTISFTKDNQSKTYDASAVSNIEDVLNIENTTSKEEVVYTIAYYDANGNLLSSKPINAGSYSVRVNVAEANAYNQASNTLTFKIAQRAISEAAIGSIAAQTYQVSAITPEPSLTYKSNTLTKGTDYTVSYKMNVYPSSSENTPTIIITGKGNFTGTTTKTFTINKKTISSNMITSIDDQEYSGFEITPPVSIYNGQYKLTQTTDYTYEYKNNVNVGTATLTVTGCGYYTGTASITFTIGQMNLQLSMIPALEEVIIETGDNLNGITLGSNSYGTWKFVNEADVTKVYSYSDSGTVLEIIFVPVNDVYKPYTSTISITVIKNVGYIKITSEVVDKVYDGLEIADITYEATGPVTIAYYKQGVLQNGKPVNAGTYKVVLTSAAVGEYEEVSTEVWFNITPKAITNSMLTPIVQQKYTGYSVKPKISIVDNGYTLVEDQDYVVYYNNNINVGAATVEIIGFGDYGLGNYSGYITTTFSIASSEGDLLDEDSNVVSVQLNEINTYTYTGSAITPEIEFVSDYGITSDDYVVTYENNVNVGIATVYVKFVNVYEGTISTTFVIAPASINNTNINIPKQVLYTGEAVEASVRIIHNQTTLTENKDYTLVYSYNVEIGTARVEISGINNYTGNIIKEFEIVTELTEIYNTIFTFNGTQKETVFITTSGMAKYEVIDHTSYDENTEVILNNVAHGESISTLLTIFDNDLSTIKVYNQKGELVTDYSKLVGLGFVLQIEIDGEVTDSITVCIKGDYNGNGTHDLFDSLVLNSLGAISSMSALHQLALDIDGDSKITLTDKGYVKNSGVLDDMTAHLSHAIES